MQAVLTEQAQMKRTEEERARAILRFEQELSDAVNAMTMERQRWEDERTTFQTRLETVSQRHTQGQQEASMAATTLILKHTAASPRLGC